MNSKNFKILKNELLKTFLGVYFKFLIKNRLCKDLLKDKNRFF